MSLKSLGLAIYFHGTAVPTGQLLCKTCIDIRNISGTSCKREREAYGSFLHSVTHSLPGERSVLEIKHHETCKTSFFDS